MITIKQISITSQGIIPLGKQGEGEVLEILFPQSSELMEESWELNHRRATDRSAYPVPLEKRGNNLVWTVTRGDTEIPGRGEAELTCYGETGQVLKSKTYGTSTAKSVTTGGEVPDPARPWYLDIITKLRCVVRSVNGVAPDASGNVEIEVGSGGSGAPGEDGGYYTPTVTQQSSGTMQVTYTPSDTSMPAVPAVDIALPVGPQGPTGKDGSPGKDGATGSPGKDGVTPTIGSNGNWYIGDTDTGKPSRGATGPAGKTPIKGTDYWTEADKQEILDELETDYTTVPDYVRTEAEKVARIINQHQSGDSIVFPFLADAHCGYYTDKNNDATRLAGQLLALIGERVSFDFVANGGDMANGAWDTTREKTYQQIEDYTELTADGQRGVLSLWMPGNHEDAPYMATAERASQTDMFALVGRKSRVSGADCPAGCNYGFLDLENRKLRVIYLDTDDKRSWGTAQVGNGESAPAYLNAHNVGGKQLKWLAETALDFTGKTSPEEWSIVVLSHVALNVSGTITDAVSGTVYANSTANAATILEAYKKEKSGSITHNDITVSYDFSKAENRAVIVCYIHGHNHAYREEQIGTIQSIGCPNVMNGRERESTDGKTYTKTAGTADGTSFCIITLDRENAMIYADHVGAGYDREWQYTIETVSYTNQLPIATDASGNVYNGVGYKADTYLSGGSEGSRSGIYATGYIPCEIGDILYCKNVGMQTNQDAHRLVFFDSDKNYLNIVKTTVTAYSGFVYGTDGNISSIRLTPSSNTGTAYIRLCCSYLGEDSVITVNEPIE